MKIKKGLAFFLTTIMLVVGMVFLSAVPAKATDAEKYRSNVTDGEFRFDLYKDNTAFCDKYTGTLSEVEFPATVTYAGVTYQVTGIGDGNNMEGVLGDTNETITKVTIPEGVESIDTYAFGFCDALETVVLPNTLQSIGDCAFSSCDNLKNVNLPEGLLSIGTSAFSGCRGLEALTIPASVTSLGKSAYYNCESLTTVTILGQIETLNSGTFSGCSSLTSCSLPTSLKEIGSSAFASAGLTQIIIPESVTTIGAGAFNKTKLTSIDIPNGVTSIGDSAFEYCSNLVNVTLPDTVETMGEKAFFCCYDIVAIHIPENLKTLEAGVFWGCFDIPSIVLPKGITSIATDAFKSCSALTEVYVPEDKEDLLDGVYVLTNATQMSYKENEDGTISLKVLQVKANQTSVKLPESVNGKPIGDVTFDDSFGDSETPSLTCSYHVYDEQLGYDKDGHYILECRLCHQEKLNYERHIWVNEKEACKCGYVPFTCNAEQEEIVYTEGYTKGTALMSTAKATLGSEVFTYQWCVNEVAIEGANEANYEIPVGLESGEYEYTCIVSYNSEISGRYTLVENIAKLTVNACVDHIFDGKLRYDKDGHYIPVCDVCHKTELNREPHDFGNGSESCKCGYVPFTSATTKKEVSVTEGYTESVFYQVNVTKTLGDEQLTYQWYENGTEILNATASSYYVPGGKTNGDYVYTCTISCGGYVKTENAGSLKIAEKPVNKADVDDKNPSDEKNDTEDKADSDEKDDTEDPVAKKGDKIKDSKKLAIYKITKTGTKTGKVGMVQYVKPVKKTKTTVTIPSTIKVNGIKYRVTSIASNAFKNNKKLKKITIGKYVTTIGDRTFYGCKKLKTITIKSKKLTTKKVGKQAFKGIYKKAIIKVPKSKLKTYKKLLKARGIGKYVKMRRY